MRRPLLNAVEMESMRRFVSDHPDLTTVVPRLVQSTVQVSPCDRTERRRARTDGLVAALMGHSLLTGPQTTRPVYLVDVRVAVPEGMAFDYEPGDSFGFFPELDDDTVAWLATRLQLDRDQCVSLQTTTETSTLVSLFPSSVVDAGEDGVAVRGTVGEILSRLDFAAFPKKATLRTLAECCEHLEERDVLLFLSSRPGSEAYNRLRVEMFSVRVLLAAMPSCRPTLATLVSLLGVLQPRYYSCCSLQSNGTCTSFQFVFNVTETTVDGRIVKGVASGWLERQLKASEAREKSPREMSPREMSPREMSPREMSPRGMSPSLASQTIPVIPVIPAIPIIRRTIRQFRLPPETTAQDTRPIIMIAAGTGISPFVGFLRAIKQRTCRPETWLFYGCRTRTDDFLFQHEIQDFQVDGVLHQFTLCLSRDASLPKMYVQDGIRATGGDFCHWMMERRALCYICGDELTMIKGVNEAIVDVISADGGIERRDVETLIQQWTREGRILRDIWI